MQYFFGRYKICTYICTRKIREHSSVGSERLPYKQRVGGSTPSAPTTRKGKSNSGRNCKIWYNCPSVRLYRKTCHILLSIRLITRQGLPTATQSAGMEPVTTLPAPIMLFFPIVTPVLYHPFVYFGGMGGSIYIHKYLILKTGNGLSMSSVPSRRNMRNPIRS